VSRGSAVCTDCGTGTYSTTVGANTTSGICLGCPSNSSSPAGSAALTSCTCNSGYTGPNGDPCAACVAGQYKWGFGNTPCSDRGANTYSNTAVGAATACVAGKYKTLTGTVTCSDCEAGTYLVCPGVLGATTCSSCAAGKYKVLTGPAACTDCLGGTYSTAVGAGAQLRRAAPATPDQRGRMEARAQRVWQESTRC
jgi:syndecan 4